MLIPFAKMQAQGNDFVILDLLGQGTPESYHQKLAKSICDRHFGVGADGLVLLLNAESAAARMVIFNSDGSRAEICGSALRCCVALLGHKLDRNELDVLTDAGLMRANIFMEEGRRQLEVDLGVPRFIRTEARAEGLEGALVDIGNRHFVSFWEELSDKPHLIHGPLIEHNQELGGALNSMYVKVIAKDEIELSIWENACGPTLACGSGAVASVFAGIHQGLLADKVAVRMPGGMVRIRRTEQGRFLLSGPVEYVFSGVYRWKI